MTNLSDEALIQAKIIKIVLDQAKRKVTMEKANVIVREAVNNLVNMSVNEGIGDERRFGSKPICRYMSEAFHEEWKKDPTQKNLTKVGVYEHRMPMQVLRAKLLDCEDEKKIIDVIKKDAFCAWITHEEDSKLNKLGLRNIMPEEGDRYAFAGIEIRPDPVQFVRRNARNRLWDGLKNLPLLT